MVHFACAVLVAAVSVAAPMHAQMDDTAIPAPVTVPLPAPVVPLASPEIPADPFRVMGVPVDVTAADVVSARERGLLQGRVAAFNRLLARIVPDDALSTMERPTQSEVVDMVQEFSIVNERTSAVRYLADLNVKFNPIAVRSFLGGRQIPFSEIYSRPLVIVSVLQTDPFAPPLLWSDPDPWSNAWADILPRDGLVPLVIPLADITDFGLLSIDQVQARDVDALMRFAARYSAGGVLIATAARTVEAADAFQVNLTDIRTTGAMFESFVPAVGQGAASMDDALRQAAIAAASQVEQAWKRRNMIQAGVGGEVVAMADVGGLGNWLTMKSELEQVQLVGKVELQAMTRTRVQLAIYHAGTIDQLQSAMALQNLELRNVDGMWTLGPSRPAMIGASPGFEVPATAATP